MHTRQVNINPLHAEVNPICHLLALLGAHHISHVSSVRVKYVTMKKNKVRAVEEIYAAPTGATKLTPTAAMEVLLNLTPLDLLIMAEARMAFYRLHIPKQPADSKPEAGLLSIWKSVGDPILDVRSD
jgi:hypothetical protein